MSPSVFYRCKTPLKELNAIGHSAVMPHRFKRRDIDRADVIVCERLYQKIINDTLVYANAKEKFIVYDIDDDYWSIHPTNPAYNSWKDPKALAALVQTINYCTLVTCTTEPLAKRLRTFHPNVKVIPNYIPLKSSPKIFVHLKKEPLIIGWAGSITHQIDLKEVWDLFPILLNKYSNVEIHLAGAKQSWMPQHSRLKFIESVPFDKYTGLLSNFDIGFAPLNDSLFNESKSDLKVLEYSMIGIPIITSNVPSYRNSILHEVTGYLANTQEEWLHYFSTLIENPELRLAMGRRARAWAVTRDISKNIDKYISAYNLET